MAPRPHLSWIGLPPWILMATALILLPILAYWTYTNLAREKQFTNQLLVEKSTALIRSFEAGTRTGMMGMMGMRSGNFRIQRLLTETAHQADISYILLTNSRGDILAHSDPERIGQSHGRTLDLDAIVASEQVQWHRIERPGTADIFEVYRRFIPVHGPRGRMHQSMMRSRHSRRQLFGAETHPLGEGQIIFVGLNTKSIDAALKSDTRHSVIMGLILILITFAGIFTLFLVQAYKNTRVNLSRVKAFSDNVVEKMPIGLITADPENRIASYNQAAASILTPWISAEAIGKRFHDVFPAQLGNFLSINDTDKKVLQQEIELPSPSGQKLAMDISVSYLADDEGTPLGRIILCRDLSEIQELKAEIERNRRLASLGKLATGIAHEIRNPLSSIRGFATFFKETHQGRADLENTADIMIQEVDRLNRVISQLLEFARPLEIQKKKISTTNLLQHSLRMVKREARSKGIRTETNFAANLPHIAVDQDRINQVLLNLYLNSIEAMPQGGQLTVRTEDDDDPSKMRITIVDTGSGITPEDMVHVFDPYFSTKQSGTGLGLAISHKIVEAHQGEIKLSSEPGRGTTATIILPKQGEE